MNNFSFTVPKVCTCGGDVKKSWYVFFYATNQDGEKKQFRYKMDINRIPKKRERLAAANELAKTLLRSLEVDGWNPFTGVCTKKLAFIIPQLQSMLDIKKTNVRPRTSQFYQSALDAFEKWCKINRYDTLDPSEFTKLMAIQYVDYMKVKRHFAGKTCNGNVSALKAIFNMLVERGKLVRNPFCGLKKSREAKGKNVAFTEKEIEIITAYMRRNDLRLFYATQFVRYAFMRRLEIMHMRVRDIDLDNHTIRIAAEVAKNGNNDSVTIPKSLEAIIKEMHLENYPSNYYVFGKRMETCGTRMSRAGDFSNAHRKVTDALKMRSDLIFYGWKHTGCVELYNKVKDPYVVCRQCRHSDIKITMKYLRSLGLGINESVREW